MNRVGFLVLVAMVLAGGTRTLSAEAEIPREKLAHLKQATVYVRVTADDEQGSGSGFVLLRLQADAYIATNSHVVNLGHASGETPAAKRVVVVFNSGAEGERETPATVVCDDPLRDIAILRVADERQAPIVHPFTPTELYETQAVFVFGFPFGEALATGGRNPAITVSRGAVSSIRKDESGQLIAVQIDASIHPGNSGGPVVDSQGRLVGIAVAQLEGTVIGLAVPAFELRETLQGRIGVITDAGFEIADGRPQLRVRGTLLDPLQRVKSLRLSCCAVSAVPKQPQQAANGRWPLLPDGAVAVDCRLTSDGFAAVLSFPPDASAGTAYYLQLAKVCPDGTVLGLEPERLTLPSTDEINWWQATSRKPSQASGSPRRSRPSHQPSAALDGSPGPFDASRATVSTVATGVTEVVADLAWSRDGKHLFLLNQNGVLSRFRRDGFVPNGTLDLEAECAVLCIASEGLVALTRSTQHLIVIDEATLHVKRRFPVPESQLVACGRESAVGFVASDAVIVPVDLASGKVFEPLATRDLPAIPSEDGLRGQRRVLMPLSKIAMTPDGKYLFAVGAASLHRLRVAGTHLELEESGPRIGHFPQRLEISTDSRFVALPCGGGNSAAPGHPAVSYGTYVYEVGNLQRPTVTISSGAYPRALAWDCVSGRIFAQNSDQQLLVFNKFGRKEGALTLSRYGDETRCLLPAPDGGQVLVLSGNVLYCVAFSPTVGVAQPSTE